jgi:hypothetical protein
MADFWFRIPDSGTVPELVEWADSGFRNNYSKFMCCLFQLFHWVLTS